MGEDKRVWDQREDLYALRKQQGDLPAVQRHTAKYLGYGDDVSAMNAEHDPLHRWLCAELGTYSRSLAQAAGAVQTGTDQFIAGLEEEAVLAIQRFMRHANGKLPRAK